VYKKILAAINEHLNSEIAARYALYLAKTCQAKLYLCFIAEENLSHADFERAEESMKRLFPKAKEMEIAVESITETGQSLERIAQVVRKESIDLVFAATRREDTQKRFFAGTRARKLFLHLPCSVAMVRVVHAGRLHPGHILVPLGTRIDHLKERISFTARTAEALPSPIGKSTSPIQSLSLRARWSGT
jgi:nucleotide-binding universal stress UspA family protein